MGTAQSAAEVAQTSPFAVPLMAAAIGGVTGLVGSGIASFTTQAVSRESRARALYNDYLERCFEMPEFASYNAFMKTYAAGRVFTFDPYQFEDIEVEKYSWFVSLMLTAMEEILGIRGGDPGWRKTIRDQVNFHGGYLEAAWPSIGPSYSKRLRALVNPLLPEKSHADL